MEIKIVKNVNNRCYRQRRLLLSRDFIIKINIETALDKEYGYKNSDFVIIATPTDYDVYSNYFYISSVEW